MTAVLLSWREYGRRTADAPQSADGASAAVPPPLILVHGLFGSSANWGGIARRLEGSGRRVLAPDLRNHGESPWDARMDYPAMAEDLATLADRLGIERAHWVGHSMGGKAAMWLALTRPERVASLVVADIAPVDYPPRFAALVQALARLPLAELAGREDADRRLAEDIPSAAVRGYLLANLVRGRGNAPQGGRGSDAWGWRIDLAVLAAAMDAILGFPDPEGRSFPGPVLFVYAGRSDYIAARALPRIRSLFPLARLRAIPEAGHWVYADRPDAFAAALTGFIDD